jgi:hypothetical protein
MRVSRPRRWRPFSCKENGTEFLKNSVAPLTGLRNCRAALLVGMRRRWTERARLAGAVAALDADGVLSVFHHPVEADVGFAALRSRYRARQCIGSPFQCIEYCQIAQRRAKIGRQSRVKLLGLDRHVQPPENGGGQRNLEIRSELEAGSNRQPLCRLCGSERGR